VQPRVTAVCLYADRPQFADLILKSFRSQTYARAHLLIYDNGENAFPSSVQSSEGIVTQARGGRSIGMLRNAANELTASDIIIHFDVDDWSHPNRIAEQVALLQASGADCVGYNEMLFWKNWRSRVKCDYYGEDVGPSTVITEHAEAWLFTRRESHYALGTSLCYWRKTWEQKPFEDIPKPGDMEGEDGRFIRGLNVHSISSLSLPFNIPTEEPRMIARIHGANSSGQYRDIARSDNWKRVPEWDERVRSILA
jgi:hypothetical protein